MLWQADTVEQAKKTCKSCPKEVSNYSFTRLCGFLTVSDSEAGGPAGRGDEQVRT